MNPIRIVIDTNVIVAAVRSQRGASNKLYNLLGRRDFEANISVPLVMEYEAVLKRLADELNRTVEEIDIILTRICKFGIERRIFFLWRPMLRDVKDEMVLELAVESQSQYIVTYNKADFAGAERFGVRAITPKEFLQLIGEIP